MIPRGRLLWCPVELPPKLVQKQEQKDDVDQPIEFRASNLSPRERQGRTADDECLYCKGTFCKFGQCHHLAVKVGILVGNEDPLPMFLLLASIFFSDCFSSSTSL